MFNLLVSAIVKGWENPHSMRMEKVRFLENTPEDPTIAFKLEDPSSLEKLQSLPTLLVYENIRKGGVASVVRYGFITKLKVAEKYLEFGFREEGRWKRAEVLKHATELGLSEGMMNRTHWAVRPYPLPPALLKKLNLTYDVVLSFAGPDRPYVQKVADALAAEGIRYFYDFDNTAGLVGVHLTEFLHDIYSKKGAYCAMFISKHYVMRVWCRHERRAALDALLLRKTKYILPGRFDDTEVPGLSSSIGYISLEEHGPEEFARIIIANVRGEVR
jgi:hypothetical protein